MLFVNEEPPFFETDLMGSRVHAALTGERGEDVRAMLSLETMGYFDDAPGSQDDPPPFDVLYPDRGDFVAVVGNVSSRALARDVVRVLRETAAISSEGAAIPAFVPGAGWSDHASFWRQGWPAVMVTDPAPFRYAHYHEPTDTVDKVDFERLSRTIIALQTVIVRLAG